MGLSVVFDLSDEDLDYFERIFSERRAGGGDVALHDVVEATGQLIATARTRGAPPFILGKLEELRPMIAMLTDEDWRLPPEDMVRVLSTLAYFADPEDLIPDDLPALGYLDDAVMVELARRHLQPEIDAYADFCSYRSTEIARREAAGEDAGRGVSRLEWLDARRRELQDHMHEKRGRIPFFGRS
jgi:uncharacterized membrane protein YkvA (DUF1232 family)